MKKVLIEGMTNNKGGKETFIINIYKQLIHSNKYDFTFIAYDDTIAYENYLKETGSTVVHIPPRSRGLFKHVFALNTLLKRNHFDVVWAHKTTLSACELLIVSKFHNIEKRIIHSHSSSNMGGRFTLLMHTINKYLLPLWATDFLACSESAAKWFYKNNNYNVIKNGIDVERFKFDPIVRSEIRESLNLNDSFVIGHVGRFGIEKNHKKLLNVFHELVQLQPNSKLILCGDGEERDIIETQINDLRLSDQVLLLGVIDNVDQVLQAMDVLVMPSLFEGLPFALLEAQASGLRCVVSDTVSQESNITGQMTFLDLDLEDSEWAKTILDVGNYEERNESIKILDRRGYNISSSASAVSQLL